ncbi:hypothetical protein [Streptomyces sp. NPDC021356]|uniref:hypothetical protein n=1 Tax=Streptomyces sp. NPDC021356 TaxID=3154900 RepID=UPI0034086D69
MCGSNGTVTTADTWDWSIVAAAFTAAGRRPSPGAVKATTMRWSGSPSADAALTAVWSAATPGPVVGAHRTGTAKGSEHQAAVRPGTFWVRAVTMS